MRLSSFTWRILLTSSLLKSLKYLIRSAQQALKCLTIVRKSIKYILSTRIARICLLTGAAHTTVSTIPKAKAKKTQIIIMTTEELQWIQCQCGFRSGIGHSTKTTRKPNSLTTPVKKSTSKSQNAAGCNSETISTQRLTRIPTTSSRFTSGLSSRATSLTSNC